MNSVSRIADLIDRTSGFVAAVARWGLLANALLITGNALARKFLGVASASAFDLQWQFFAAVALLTAAHTLRRDEHVRVDVLAPRLGRRGMAWIDLVGFAVVLIPACLAVVAVSWPLFQTAFVEGQTRSTRESTSDLPAWIILGFIPFGFGLLALQGIAEVVRRIERLRGNAAARGACLERTEKD